MRAIDGKLDITETYKILSVHTSYRNKDDDGVNFDVTTCDNCGQILANWAVVENSKGIKFIIGLDCADTILSLNSKSFSYLELKESKKKMAREKRFLKWLFSECKCVIVDEAGRYANLYNRVVDGFEPRYRIYSASCEKYKTQFDILKQSGSVVFRKESA